MEKGELDSMLISQRRRMLLEPRRFCHRIYVALDKLDMLDVFTTVFEKRGTLWSEPLPSTDKSAPIEPEITRRRSGDIREYRHIRHGRSSCQRRCDTSHECD